MKFKSKILYTLVLTGSLNMAEASDHLRDESSFSHSPYSISTLVDSLKELDLNSPVVGVFLEQLPSLEQLKVSIADKDSVKLEIGSAVIPLIGRSLGNGDILLAQTITNTASQKWGYDVIPLVRMWDNSEFTRWVAARNPESLLTLIEKIDLDTSDSRVVESLNQLPSLGELPFTTTADGIDVRHPIASRLTDLIEKSLQQNKVPLAQSITQIAVTKWKYTPFMPLVESWNNPVYSRWIRENSVSRTNLEELGSARIAFGRITSRY